MYYMGVVMFLKLLSVALLAACFSASSAQAQSTRAPSELPPAGFKGQQYVDSRGCVYLRAGIGGRVNWVARISANREPLCGYPPTSGAQRVAVAPAAAPPVAAAQTAPVPVAAPSAPQQVATAKPKAAYSSKVGKPMMTTAGRYERPAVSVPVAAPARPAPVAAQAAARTNGCPERAPYGKRAQLSDGRSSLVCSATADFDVAAAVRRYEQRQGTYTVVAAAAPAVPRAITPRRGAGSVLTAEDNANGYYAPDQVARNTADPARRGGYNRAPATAAAPDNTEPTGYRRVVRAGYSDYGYKPVEAAGRYNTQSGQGTEAGWAQQDQIWTRDVPSTLVSQAPVQRAGRMVTSTSNAARRTPTQRETAAVTARRGGYYVQVGSFGEPANADGASARLARVGLPVATARAHRNGRGLRVVLAGPFASAGQARDALGRVRGAGFGDAFIR